MKGCTCDLTGNGCDLNCCCDTDCSTADQQAFTECKDTDVKYVPLLLSLFINLSFCWIVFLVIKIYVLYTSLFSDKM